VWVRRLAIRRQGLGRAWIACVQGAYGWRTAPGGCPLSYWKTHALRRNYWVVHLYACNTRCGAPGTAGCPRRRGSSHCSEPAFPPAPPPRSRPWRAPTPVLTGICRTTGTTDEGARGVAFPRSSGTRAEKLVTNKDSIRP